MEYSFHPLAMCFPMLSEKELEALKLDIRQNGQLESIWVDTSGRIFDGRNRYIACKALGIEPKVRQWRDDDPPAAMIAGLNLHRRHLTAGQRSMIAVKFARALEADRKRRQEHNRTQESLGAQRCAPVSVRSVDEVAGALDVSGRAVTFAKAVSDYADPVIKSAVEKGEMGVSVAAALSVAPVEVQRKAAKSPKPKEVLKEWKKAKREAEAIKDYEGHAIESDAIRAAFSGESDIEDARKLAVDLEHLLFDICHGPAGVYLNLQDMESTIGHIKTCLKLARPHSLCPKCSGDGCKLCRSVGWVTKEMWERHK